MKLNFIGGVKTIVSVSIDAGVLRYEYSDGTTDEVDI